MVEDSKILNTLKSAPKWSFFDLARALNVKSFDNRRFGQQLRNLVEKRLIFESQSGFYYVPKILFVTTSELRLNARGFGFVDFLPTDASVKMSAFVAPTSVNGAFDGDEVEIAIFADVDRAEAFQAIVRKILKRYKSTFVGRVSFNGAEAQVMPLDKRLLGKFIIVNAKSLQAGWEVKVRITHYGAAVHQVELISVLGHYQDVAVDILAAIEDANIVHVFAPATLAAASAVSQSVLPSELAGRTDLRDELIVTIDGDDTKDFDDAIHIKKLVNGNFILGVHIADVSHYVTAGSPLDLEALQRGTSVYLADRVIPMLPEALSNHICSLNPRVDRLTLTAEIEIDNEGKTVNAKVYPSVINSKARLTYQQVNAFYNLNQPLGEPALHQMLNLALQLSKVVRKQKLAEGYIDFEIEESKLIIDSAGKTVDIVARERLASEMLIEDFMVRANEVVAELVSQMRLPFIYRVHAKPDLDRLKNLQGAIKALNIDVTIPTQANPREFAKTIEQLKQTRFDSFMKTLMLRTMAKAEYSAQNIGHFGLASRFYTHFTSPIRRYPDLMVHRMLRDYVFNANLEVAATYQATLPAIAASTSAAEVKASDLERQVSDIKKAEFYARYVGQAFTGTIVSIMSFGFFVEFPNKVDGLVHVSSLIDGQYALTNNNFSLASAKRVFTIGDEVSVVVVQTAKDEGKIDLVLADLYDAWQVRKPTSTRQS